MTAWTRRTALKSGLGAVGALGLASAATSTPAIAAPREETIVLRVERVSAGVAGRRRSERRSRGDHAHVEARLIDAQGRAVGSFAATGSVVGGSGRHSSSAIHTVCTHVFVLPAGQILGAGAGHSDRLHGTYAVIGGTGRYAGARGSYTIAGGRSGDFVTIELAD